MLIPHFVSLAEADKARDEYDGRIAAEIGYGLPDPGVTHLYIEVPMAQLGPQPVTELWLADERVSTQRHGDVHLVWAGDALFGCVFLSPSSEADFEQNIAAVYRSISDAVTEAGYPHLHRIWNYFGHIHTTVDGLDRYQKFCRARQPSLTAHCRRLKDGFPAATAIGHLASGGTVYFISGRTAGHHQENPRQVSAYEYPAQYGPQSPSFARATLVRSRSVTALYISGTASIVGHRSRHQEEPIAQFHETVSNVQEVMAAASQASGSDLTGISRLSNIKIYLRRPQDYAAVHALAQSIFEGVPQMYMQGDLCRRELLLEIEAFAQAV